MNAASVDSNAPQQQYVVRMTAVLGLRRAVQDAPDHARHQISKIEERIAFWKSESGQGLKGQPELLATDEGNLSFWKTRLESYEAGDAALGRARTVGSRP